MSREKTNSITHLVKIVAEEIIAEHWDNVSERVHILEGQVKALFNGQGYLAKVHGSITNAGEIWTRDEDEILIQELRTAIVTIAQNHKRSTGAIKSRISQELIKMDALKKGHLVL